MLHDKVNQAYYRFRTKNPQPCIKPPGTTLKYLRLNLPEHATPEKAIFLLEQRHAHYKKP